MTDTSTLHETWTVEREYPHPPQRVFTAWADPKIKVRWFDLSHQENPEYVADFRVGGRESFGTPPGASPAFTYDAEYHDIVDGERIVTSYEMTMDGRLISVSVATVTLTPTAGGTRLTYTEQGVYLDGLDTGASRRSGTEAQLDALSTVLKELA